MPDQVNIWSDTDTRDKLRRVADFYRRSMAAQLRWMVDRELEKIDGHISPSPAEAVVEELRREIPQEDL